MKTSLRNIIASLFIGTTAFNVNAENITTGSLVNTNNQEVITYTVHHTTCANTSNGSIDIEVANGAAYFFSWDNGMNAEDISGLAAGSYRLKIETNEGEILVASFDVEAPAELEGEISQDNLLSAVSITEETASFQLYPNPSNGNGTITWNNATVEQINIVNAAGQVVNSLHVQNTTSATFDGLTAGIYVAQLVTADTTNTLKFIVQ